MFRAKHSRSLVFVELFSKNAPPVPHKCMLFVLLRCVRRDDTLHRLLCFTCFLS
jgi:hypothetical protein